MGQVETCPNLFSLIISPNIQDLIQSIGNNYISLCSENVGPREASKKTQAQTWPV